MRRRALGCYHVRRTPPRIFRFNFDFSSIFFNSLSVQSLLVHRSSSMSPISLQKLARTYSTLIPPRHRHSHRLQLASSPYHSASLLPSPSALNASSVHYYSPQPHRSCTNRRRHSKTLTAVVPIVEGSHWTEDSPYFSEEEMMSPCSG